MNLIAAAISMCALMVQVPLAGTSGTIQGAVCDVEGCKPIRGARVSVEIPNSGGMKQTAITDQTGTFRFPQLPAGKYQLEAEADDFIPVATLPFVTLDDGGRVEDLKVLMHAMGTISGQAIDENGKPLAVAHVEAMVFQQDMYLRMLVPVRSTTTNTRGEFRLSGLDPNEYLIRVTSPMDRRGIDDYPPTFYPAATDPGNSVKIQINGGTDVAGIEVRLPSRGVRVTGRVVTAAGEPTRAIVYLIPRSSILVAPQFTSGRMSQEFEIGGVPPGSYYLYAVTDLSTQSVQSPVDYRVPPQWARTPIDIGDKDIDDVTVSILATGSINGRIVFSSEATDIDTLDLSKVLLQAGPTDVTPGPPWSLVSEISKTGEFRFEHLSEMPLFFRNTIVSGDWFVSQLILERSDVTSSGFSAAPGENRILDVVISNAGGSLTGIIKDREDKPVPAGRVVLLPEPSLRASPSLRRISLANEGGEFLIETIAPGEYTAIAFPPEGQFQPMFLQDVHWIEEYERFGQHLHIGARQATRTDLVTVTPNPK
jgi:hypothetical protein